jgi:hypothetical protein
MPTHRLIVFSDDWGRHPSSSQHLVERLLDRVDDVVWINTIGTRPPRLSAQDLGKIAGKLRAWFTAGPPAAPRPNKLRVVSPRMWPGFRASWQRRFNARQMANRVNQTLGPRREGEYRIAMTTLPIAADLPGKIDVDRWVYYCVDDFAAWPGLDGHVMRDMERDLVAKMDAAVAVSNHLVEHLRSVGTAATLLTHGIDRHRWSPQIAASAQAQSEETDVLDESLPRWWPDTDGPILLFWGLIDQRLDVAMIEQAAARWNVLLVGPAQFPDPALGRMNRVMMPGPVRFERLPRLAAAADVLIMPYRDLPVTRAMQPLKFKEYLATGKPVVARKLPATLEWLDAADLVDSPADFVAAVAGRIGRPLPDEQAAARQRLSRETWENKVAQLWNVLCGREREQLDRRSSAEP